MGAGVLIFFSIVCHVFSAANVSGFSLEEYSQTCRKMDAQEQVGILEVNIVKKAMHVLAQLEVDMVNLHAAGTKAMMEAALEGLTIPGKQRPLLIAVTQLTSTSEARMQEDLLISRSLDETVLHYAKNARDAGLDGVVCSPLEAGKIHAACGASFLTVTPGVRFAGGSADDQVRITTPAKAKEIGSDYIVVGRPITQAEDPLAAWRKCVREFVD